jgi:hypothetical protein
VFWDIENVGIPYRQNVFDIVMRLRQRLIVDRNLVEGTFTTYCDVTSLSQQHRMDLCNANVTTKDLGDHRHGAADRAIYMDLQLFKEQHKTPATIVLLSGDIDFIKYINALRFGHRHYIIVIHNPQARHELLKTANEAYPWHEFTGRCRKEPSITLSNKANPVRTSRPLNVPGKYNKFTPSSKCKPSMNLLESTSSNQNKNEKCPDAQPGSLSMPFSSDLLDTTLVTNKSVDPSRDNSPVPKEKKKTDKSGHLFCCSMCNKTFSTDAGRVTHEKVKHEVGTLVELLHLTLTDDLNGHHEPSSHDNHPNIDLMTSHDDDDFDPLRSSLLTTTRETIRPIIGVDDNNNPHGPFLELSDDLRTIQINDSSRLDSTLIINKSVDPSRDNSPMSKNKNTTAKTGHLFCCSMCNKTFSTDAGRVTHEKDKHKVGTLVELLPLTLTDDLNGHHEPSSHDNHPNIDLTAYDDGDGFDLLPSSLLTTTGETISPIKDVDDDNNSHGPFLELSDDLQTIQINDSARLQANFSGNEKPIEIDPLPSILLTTTGETISPIKGVNDDNNSHGPFLELSDDLQTIQINDSAQLQANFSVNEKPIESDTEKNTIVCE